MINQGEDRTEREVTFFRFEDLRIYHKSLDYINWLNDASALYPTDDKTQVVERWNQSARNITFLLAEGSSRNKSQFIYYLKMAKSAVRECLVYTSISHNLGLFDALEEEESRGQLMEMTKMIGALISSLQRNNNTKRDEDSDSYEPNNSFPPAD